jgi:hypothetical protein
MSMLTNGLERAFDSAEGAPLISLERKAQFKRVALQGLALLSMGSVLTALIALKTAIYLWHLHA